MSKSLTFHVMTPTYTERSLLDQAIVIVHDAESIIGLPWSAYQTTWEERKAVVVSSEEAEKRLRRALIKVGLKFATTYD